MNSSEPVEAQTQQARAQISRILQSNVVWRLSGLTYPSAVIATRGSWLNPREYIADSRRQVSGISTLVRPTFRVLEFGCGLGGNLIALHDRIKSGIGVDINPLYLFWADALACRFAARNLEFIPTSPYTIVKPSATFDFVFSIGAFERIPSRSVTAILSQIEQALKPGGEAVLYFLQREAMLTEFVDRLGPEAYTYFTDEQVQCFAERADLRQTRPPQAWGYGTDKRTQTRTVISRVYFFRKNAHA